MAERNLHLSMDGIWCRRTCQLQQLEQELAVNRRQCRSDHSLVLPLSCKSQINGQSSQRQCPRRCPRNQAINHPRADEEQRVHLFDRRLEVKKLLQRELGLDGLKWVGRYSSRNIAPELRLLTKPCNQIHLRQCGQFSQSANPPDGKGFRVVLFEIQHGKWELCKHSCFLPFWNHSNSA